MAKYYDPTTQTTSDIGNPDLNPTLTAGKAQVADTTPLGTAPISSSMFLSQPSVNASTPPAPTVANVSGLDTTTSQPSTDTTATGQASDINTRLQAINSSLIGKSAYQIQQENAQGVPALFKTQNDLSAQLKALQNEATGYNLKAQTIPNQIQQDYQGRGATEAGVAPITAGALRMNQIQAATTAAQALTVSSALEATKGNIATAQYLADRAVTQKYGAIEEEQKAKIANLELIMKSPQYDIETKARATEQQVVEQQKLADIQQTKTNALAAQTEAIKYAGIVTDPVVYQKLQAAKNPVEVAQIAAQAGYVLPQAGRYKDTITQTTDAYGNQISTVRVFDTITGKFVDNTGGQNASQLNARTISGPSSSVSAGKLDFNQYGLLANTNYSPKNEVDTLAQSYLDKYIKNGQVPTASSLGRGIKPSAFGQVEQRARDLYFQATGTALPNPEIIKGYQKIVNANNTFVNNLKTQEGTVKANFGLSLENLKNADLNSSNVNAINNFLDNVKQFWLGNSEAAQYALQNATVTNEIGSLLAVRNATGTTVHDKLVSSGLIPKGASLDQQKSMLQTLLTEADNAKTSLGTANADLYKQIDPLLQDPNNPLRDQYLQSQQPKNQSSVEVDPQKQKIGDTFTYKGHTVRKTGADQYEVVSDTLPKAQNQTPNQPPFQQGSAAPSLGLGKLFNGFKNPFFK